MDRGAEHSSSSSSAAAFEQNSKHQERDHHHLFALQGFLILCSFDAFIILHKHQ